MHGQRVCSMHGGKTPAALRKADERIAEAKALEAAGRLGLGQGEILIDPAEAMLAQVRKAAYNVEWYERAIASLEPRIGKVRHGDVSIPMEGEWADSLLESLAKEAAGRAAGEVIADTVVLYLPGERTDTITAHTLVELYNAERDRLVKYSAECRRAGVEERRIEITAELGRQLVAILRAAAAAQTAGVLALLDGHPELVERVRAFADTELPQLVAVEVAKVRNGSAA